METKRIDYKALCEAPFEMESLYEDNFPMLVYTGRKEEERPVFRVVFAKGACKVVIGQQGKEFGDHWLGPENWRNAMVQLQRLCQLGELGSVRPAAEDTLRLDGTD